MFQEFQEQSQLRGHYAEISVFDKQELYAICAHQMLVLLSLMFTILVTSVVRETFLPRYKNLCRTTAEFKNKSLTALPLQNSFSPYVKVVTHITISSSIITVIPEHQAETVTTE